MGGLFAKGKLRRLGLEKNALLAQCEEYEKKIAERKAEHEIEEISKDEQLDFLIHQEQLRATNSIKIFDRLIGVKIENWTIETLLAHFLDLDDCEDKTSPYLCLRVEESQIESRICRNLMDFIEKIKELNINKSEILIESIEKLELELASFPNLIKILNQIKNQEKILSSNQEDILEKVSLELTERSELEKELVLLQRKHAFQMYNKQAEEKHAEIEKMKNLLAKVKKEKEDLLDHWESMKSSDGKIESEEMLEIRRGIQTKLNQIAQTKASIEDGLLYLQNHADTVSELDLYKEKLQKAIARVKSALEEQDNIKKEKENLMEDIKALEKLKKKSIELKLHERGIESHIRYLKDMSGSNQEEFSQYIDKMNQEVHKLEDEVQIEEVKLQELCESRDKLKKIIEKSIKKMMLRGLTYVTKVGPEQAFKRWVWSMSDS
ncbi:unnamed protein product [Blepharisma stoltei]|uniref:Uncharacterized protein n=1 Tax=Blepharisma stoltei TaxID=1481888 RepID=A0AAU9JTN1_9CILI|nr:unnamed protein product [Blepharisma stoltei]